MIEGFIIMVVTAILIRFCYEVITYEPKPPTTLPILPPEPTDKGHWWDGIHVMD
jgi:hypothetical protein